MAELRNTGNIEAIAAAVTAGTALRAGAATANGGVLLKLNAALVAALRNGDDTAAADLLLRSVLATLSVVIGGAGGVTLGIADGVASRLLVTQDAGAAGNSALRLIGFSSNGPIQIDVVANNSSAAERQLELQPNGGDLKIGSTTVKLPASTTIVANASNAAKLDDDNTAGNTRLFVGIGGGIGLIRAQVGAVGTGGSGTKRALIVDYGS